MCHFNKKPKLSTKPNKAKKPITILPITNSVEKIDYATILPPKIITYAKSNCELPENSFNSVSEITDVSIYVAFIERIGLLNGKSPEYAQNFDLKYWQCFSQFMSNAFNIDSDVIDLILDDRLLYYEKIMLSSTDRDNQLLTQLTQFLMFDKENSFSIWNKTIIVIGILEYTDLYAHILDMLKKIKHDLSLYRMSIMFGRD